MDGTYMPYPCKEECFEPLKWPHVLSTINVSVLPKPIKFCTPQGYDIQPFLMITSTYKGLDDQSIELQFYCQDQVSVEDTALTMYSLAKDGNHKECLEISHIDVENDIMVPESKLKKFCLLLKGSEVVSMSILGTNLNVSLVKLIGSFVIKHWNQ